MCLEETTSLFHKEQLKVLEGSALSTTRSTYWQKAPSLRLPAALSLAPDGEDHSLFYDAGPASDLSEPQFLHLSNGTNTLFYGVDVGTL